MTATAILASVVTKVCTKCGETKPATSEYFLTRCTKTGALKTKCKVCGAAYRKSYYADKKEWFSEYNKEYRKANLAAVKAQKKSKYELNRSAVIQKAQAYRESNRVAARQRAANYTRRKAASDPMFAMALRVKALISTRLRAGGYTKKSRSHEILGCDWHFFKTHIERQFVPGMTWENRSDWHLDHFVPLSSAKDEAELLALNHYTNLRPMWAADNIRKSNKMAHLI